MEIAPGLEKVVHLGYGSAVGASVAAHSQHNQSAGMTAMTIPNQDLIKVLNSIDSSDISKNEEDIQGSASDTNKYTMN